jgi:hypothetical protein
MLRIIDHSISDLRRKTGKRRKRRKRGKEGERE